MPAISAQLRKAVEYATLHKHFQQYFKVVPAVTDELVAEAQRIRHKVYCEELGWEPEKTDGREKDEYDPHAIHCLLRSVSRDIFIGCIRLVLPTEKGTDLHLPMQNSCGDKLFPGHPDPVAMANREVAEVSRLAIIREFRRRRQDEGHNIPFPKEQQALSDRRKFPYIPVALYLGMMELASQNNINTLYFMTEPLLARHFSRLGGDLQLVGEGVEHRGLRKPYLMDVNLVRRKASFALKPLIKVIRNDIEHYKGLKERNQPIPFMENGTRKDFRDL